MYGAYQSSTSGYVSSWNGKMCSAPALYSNSRHLFEARAMPAFFSNR